MEFSCVLIMSVLIEAIITYAKTWVVEKKIKWQQIAAVIFGIVICLAYNLDIPAMIGFESAVPYVGKAITGILISRGSNFVYELFKAIKTKSDAIMVGVGEKEI